FSRNAMKKVNPACEMTFNQLHCSRLKIPFVPGQGYNNSLCFDTREFITLNYAKQTQFPKRQNEHRLSFNKGL
ncbi:MAG: hypothetical protein JSV82_03170, partial [Planctomycetota bacterium]